MIKYQKQRMRLLLGAMALLAFEAPSVAWATDLKPSACEDRTPHKIRMVKVAPGVQLEVLDFGGSGDAMVLLTGIGDNAHVWDDFAYQFIDFFRVIGITRRGFGASDKPPGGYDVRTRARDDIAVLDRFGIDKAVFVGHSIAGSELSQLGLAHPRRVDKLVYLDALDRAEVPREEQELPPPPFADDDSSSLRAFQAALARLQGNREPNAAFCNTLLFNRSGRIVDNVTPEEIRAKVFAEASKQAADDELAKDQSTQARHLRSVHQRGAAGLLLVPEPSRAGRVRCGMGADRRLGSEDHRQVRGREFSEHVPAAQCSPLYLHQQRGRGRALDTGSSGHTAKTRPGRARL